MKYSIREARSIFNLMSKSIITYLTHIQKQKKIHTAFQIIKTMHTDYFAKKKLNLLNRIL